MRLEEMTLTHPSKPSYSVNFLDSHSISPRIGEPETTPVHLLTQQTAPQHSENTALKHLQSRHGAVHATVRRSRVHPLSSRQTTYLLLSSTTHLVVTSRRDRVHVHLHVGRGGRVVPQRQRPAAVEGRCYLIHIL